MLSFPGAGRGLAQQSSPHFCFVLFQLFSVFFNFFFLNYLAVVTCSCLLLFIFSFFIREYWKKYMYVFLFASFCWMSECIFSKLQPKC